MESILENITLEIKEDMETIWFTADLHHGHPKIIDIHNRPITGDDKKIKDLNHTEWLVKEVINKFVKKGHTLYIIGDISLAKKNEAEKFVDKLNGNKFLIMGNHDKNLKNSTRFTQITIRKDFTYSKFGLNIHIVLDHFPMFSWNRKIYNSWHLYGHVHGRLKNFGNSFDVGIDNPELHEITGGIYRPLNLYEIIEIMEKRRPLKFSEIISQFENNETN